MQQVCCEGHQQEDILSWGTVLHLHITHIAHTTCTHTDTCTHTHAHTRIHMHAPHMHAPHMHAYAHARTCTCTHMHMHTHAHTHTHTTHAHKLLHTNRPQLTLFSRCVLWGTGDARAQEEGVLKQLPAPHSLAADQTSSHTH